MKVGDIVVLKSGGPNMVISALNNRGSAEGKQGTAICNWMHEGNYHCSEIPKNALQLYHEPKHNETGIFVTASSPHYRYGRKVEMSGDISMSQFKEAFSDILSLGATFRFSSEED
ncbi:hypothetical protein [Acinetobacter phage ABPH49]|nr:hypothetical protein [Acinetobacter phage ABPH49]